MLDLPGPGGWHRSCHAGCTTFGLVLHWFPAIAARNSRDMEWKSFLCKQPCEPEQVFNCKAPSCAVCTGHWVCFGPEE